MKPYSLKGSSSGSGTEKMVPLQVLEREREIFEERSRKVVVILQAKDKEIASLKAKLKQGIGGEKERNEFVIEKLKETNRTLRAQVADQAEQIEVLIAEIASLRNDVQQQETSDQARKATHLTSHAGVQTSSKSKSTSQNLKNPGSSTLYSQDIDTILVNAALEQENAELKAKLAALTEQIESVGDSAYKRMEDLNNELKAKLQKAEEINETARASVIALEEEIQTLKESVDSKSRQLKVATANVNIGKLKCSKCRNSEKYITDLEERIRKTQIEVHQEKQTNERLSQKLAVAEAKKGTKTPIMDNTSHSSEIATGMKKSEPSSQDTIRLQIDHLEKVVVQQSQELVHLRTQLVQLGAKKRRVASDHHIEKRALMSKIVDLEQSIRQNIDNGSVKNRHLNATIRMLSGKSDLHAKLALTCEENRTLQLEHSQNVQKLQHIKRKFADSESAFHESVKQIKVLEKELQAFRSSSVYGDIHPVAHQVILERLSLENEKLKSRVGQASKSQPATFDETVRIVDDSNIQVLSDERLEELKRDMIECSARQRQRSFSELEYFIRSLQTELEGKEHTIINLEKKWFQSQDELNSRSEKHAKDNLELAVSHSKQLENIGNRINNQLKEINLLTAEKDKALSEFENCRVKLRMLETEYERRSSKEHERLENLQKQVHVLNAERISYENQVRSLKRGIAEHKSQVGVLTETLHVLQSSALPKNSVFSTQSIVEDAKKSIQNGNVNKAFESLAVYVKTLTLKLLTSKRVESTLNHRCNELHGKLRSLEENNDALKISNSNLESRMKEKQLLFNEEKDMNISLKSLLENAEQYATNVYNDFHNASVALIDVQSQLDATESQRDTAVSQLVNIRNNFDKLLSQEVDKMFAKLTTTNTLAQVAASSEELNIALKDLLTMAKFSSDKDKNDTGKKLFTLEKLAEMMTRCESERLRINRDNVILRKESAVFKGVLESMQRQVSILKNEKLEWIRERSSIIRSHEQKIAKTETHQSMMLTRFQERARVCQEKYISAYEKCALLVADCNGLRAQLTDADKKSNSVGPTEMVEQAPVKEHSLRNNALEDIVPQEQNNEELRTMSREDMEQLLKAEREAKKDLVDRLEVSLSEIDALLGKNKKSADENESKVSHSNEIRRIENVLTIDLRACEEKAERLERELISTRARLNEMRMRAETSEERGKNSIENLIRPSHSSLKNERVEDSQSEMYDNVDGLKQLLKESRRQIVELTCEYEAKLNKATMHDALLPGLDVKEMQQRLVSQAEQIRDLGRQLETRSSGALLVEKGLQTENMAKVPLNEPRSDASFISSSGLVEKRTKKKHVKKKGKLKSAAGLTTKDVEKEKIEDEIGRYLGRIRELEALLEESKSIEKKMQDRISQMGWEHEENMQLVESRNQDKISKLELELSSLKAHVDSPNMEELSTLSIRTSQLKLHQVTNQMNKLKEKNMDLSKLLSDALDSKKQLRTELEHIRNERESKSSHNLHGSVDKASPRASAATDVDNGLQRHEINEGPIHSLQVRLENFLSTMRPPEKEGAVRRLQQMLERTCPIKEKTLLSPKHSANKKGDGEYTYELETTLGSLRAELERTKLTEEENKARTAVLESSMQLAESNAKSVQTRLSEVEPIMSSLRREIHQLKQELEQSKEENERCMRQMDTYSKENECHIKEITELGILKLKLEENVSDLEEQLDSATELHEKALSDINDLQEEIKQKEIEENEAISQLAMRNEELEAQIAESSRISNGDKNEQHAAEIQKLKNQLKSKLERSDKRAQHWKKMSEELKSTLKEMRNDWKSPKQISRMTQQIEQVKAEKKRLKDQVTRKSELLATTQAKWKIEQAGEEKLREKVAKLEIRSRSAELDASNKEKLLRNLRDKMEDLIKQKSKLEAQFESVQSINKKCIREKNLLRAKIERMEVLISEQDNRFRQIDSVKQKDEENDRSKSNLKLRSLRNKTNKFKREAENLQKTIQRNNELLQQRDQTVFEQKLELNKYKKLLDDKKREADDLSKEISALQEAHQNEMDSIMRTLLQQLVDCLCQSLDQWVTDKQKKLEAEQKEKLILNQSGNFDSVAKIIDWSPGDVCDVLGVQFMNNDPSLAKQLLSTREAAEGQKSRLRAKQIHFEQNINTLCSQDFAANLICETFRLASCK